MNAETGKHYLGRMPTQGQPSSGPRRPKRDPLNGGWISGRHPVREALRAGLPADRLLLRDKGDSGFVREMRRLAASRKLEVEACDNRILDRTLRHTEHRGVALRLLPQARPVLKSALPELLAREPAPLLLLLDGIQDPQNLGSVARTAEAVGVSALLLGEADQAPVGDAAFRSSAGALAWLPIWDAGRPEQALDLLGEAGIQRIGLNEKAETLLHEARADYPLVLVLGGEGRGLSQRVRQRLDLELCLPMTGHVASLNASVAAAVTLYQLARERLTNDKD